MDDASDVGLLFRNFQRSSHIDELFVCVCVCMHVHVSLSEDLFIYYIIMCERIQCTSLHEWFESLCVSYAQIYGCIYVPIFMVLPIVCYTTLFSCI